MQRDCDRVSPVSRRACGNEVAAILAKIHGCIRLTANPATNLVLTESDYRKLRGDQRYRTLLQSLILGHTLLTVGFSLRDPDFLGIIADLYEVFGDTLPSSYALVRRPAPEDRAHWLKKGVVLIPYEEHSDLRSFFGELHALSERKYPQNDTARSAADLHEGVGGRAQAWKFYANPFRTSVENTDQKPQYCI